MMTTLDAHPSTPTTLPPAMVTARRIVHWSLVPWVLFALTVPMALAADDPSLAYTLIIGVWSYGPLAMLCSLAGRLLWPRGHHRVAVVAVAIPLAILGAFVLFMLVGTLVEYGLP
jgi:hypothetical protein